MENVLVGPGQSTVGVTAAVDWWQLGATGKLRPVGRMGKGSSLPNPSSDSPLGSHELLKVSEKRRWR